MDHEIKIESTLQFCHSSAPGSHLGTQRTMNFTGPPSSRMRGRFAAHVSNAKEREEPFLGDNRCLNNPCCSVMSLMFGV